MTENLKKAEAKKIELENGLRSTFSDDIRLQSLQEDLKKINEEISTLNENIKKQKEDISKLSV